MNLKELKELIEFLEEKNIAEFEMERGDVKVRIKRAGEPADAPRRGRAAVLRGSAGSGARA
jgi:biotin carboxyl carrier protein